MLGPIRRVQFTRATSRQSNIRENKGPSLGKIQVKILHQRSPNATKFEDRSPEEAVRQERCARRDAWVLAKNIHELKKGRQSYIPFALSGVDFAGRIHKKPEERKFVVDSGASMHMVSKKDLNKADLETLRISKNQTMVVTAKRKSASKRGGNGKRPKVGLIRYGKAS